MKFRRPRFIAFSAFCIALVSIAVLPSGCEWESSGDDDTWSDSMSWANFSGLYRSGTSGRALVSNFSLTSGGTGDTDTDSDDTTSEYTETAVTDLDVFTIDALFTTIGNTIDYSGRGTSGWSLKPGSVNVRIESSVGTVGNFADNGSGGLSGTFSQGPGGTVYDGVGTVDYDTGAWSLSLEASFLPTATFSYDYTILSPNDGTEVVVDDDDDEDPPTGDQWLYTLQVEQTGNQLRFTDNRGLIWTGTLSAMTTPGGDTSGATAGAVVGTFSATESSGSEYTITGTFTGTYTVSEDATIGQLTSRVIQGIWMESQGNGDLYGETTDGAATTVTTTE